MTMMLTLLSYMTMSLMSMNWRRRSMNLLVKILIKSLAGALNLLVDVPINSLAGALNLWGR